MISPSPSQVFDKLRSDLQEISHHNQRYFRKKAHTPEEKKRHLQVMMKISESRAQLAAISNHRAA